ncbi:MAG: hypothetical protein ACLGI9_14765 [Thermoanaerobaculia bacterium]
MKPTTLTQTLTALLALAVLCAPAAAQNRPSSDLLLPYFEVDAANPGGLTTLFAVGNATKKPVDVLATVHTNWGIPILEVPFALQPNEVRTYNLRDWFRHGGNPSKALAAIEIQHLGAAASGRRSPKDNLYYSSEVRPDLQVGYVILRTQGNRPDALWGDWFNVDVAGNLARGDVLANIDRSSGCPGLCQRHLLRYLSGGGFDGGTEIIIWRENQGKPSASPVPAASLEQQADATAFDEPGRPIENRKLALLPVEKVLVSELDFKEPFGSLDLISEAYTFIAVQHTADNRYSVGLTTYCLERETPPGPGIEIVKLTNGEDADAAPGPSIPVGATVNWEYLVTNTGDVELTGIEVVDDQEGAVDCPADTLAPGESMTCKASGKARACQYSNVGTVSALSSSGEITDSDASHYFGDDGAKLSISSIQVNGQDAGASPGPLVDAGQTLNWSFKLTNDGKVALKDVKLAGINASCARTELGAGESTTCTATGKAQSGQHSLPVSAKGSSSCADATADGTGYYQTLPNNEENPGLTLVKLTNGQDGAQIPAGSPITWTYKVTNTGDVALSDIHVTDDKGVAVSCPKTSLAAKESMTCTGTGVAQACQYENTGTVTAKSPAGDTVSASDKSSYFGTTQPGISIETAVNGSDADSPKGPEVAAGSPVSFSYVVKNTGNVTLTGIQVTDSKGVGLTCPGTELAAGAAMTCTGSGTAQSGQYASVGTATGTGACGQSVSDDDPVHYYGTTHSGSQGCTPGYWKNHEKSWPATGYSTGQTVSSVFSQASLYPSLGSATLHQALYFEGGSDITGAAGNLLRAATAGLLNTAHSGVDYPWLTAQLISEVNAALATQNRETILGLASVIDKNNNLGCPLN